MYISLSGLDGCGKDSQMSTIKELLISEGISEEHILIVNEPGGNPNATEIANLLKYNEKIGNLSKEAELLLMVAARVELQENTIIPFIDRMADMGLNKGQWAIISNRCHLCSYAYQAIASEKTMMMYHSLHVEDLMVLPDMPIILSITPEESFRRLSGTKLDRLEAVSMDVVKDRWTAFSILSASTHTNYPTPITIPSQETVDDTSLLLTMVLSRAISRYRHELKTN